MALSWLVGHSAEAVWPWVQKLALPGVRASSLGQPVLRESGLGPPPQTVLFIL